MQCWRPRPPSSLLLWFGRHKEWRRWLSRARTTRPATRPSGSRHPANPLPARTPRTMSAIHLKAQTLPKRDDYPRLMPEQEPLEEPHPLASVLTAGRSAILFRLLANFSCRQARPVRPLTTRHLSRSSSGLILI